MRLCCTTVYLVTPFVFLSRAPAQEKKLVEPEIIGLVHVLDSETSSIVPLERQTGKGRVGLRRAAAEITGQSSPVRIRALAKQEFVVNVPAGTDPSRFSIYVMDGKKGKRQTTTAKVGLFSDVVGGGTLQVNASKYGQSSYKLTPAQVLPPGEYCFSPPGESYDLFCFGINSK
jgi:hypothetical protein